MLKFGVIGYGYWGPNIVRNLRSLDGCQVVGICDQNPSARKRIEAAHLGIPVYSDYKELVSAPDVDVVAVITPGRGSLGAKSAPRRRKWRCGR